VGEDGLAGLDFVVSYRSGTPSTTNARSSGATKVRRFPSQPPGK
jgi:hypothetical protein